ncbi:MAG: RteC domain-containing protein [Bacteroidetes bacterium]|nr:RteC domain-containing protein [Bacteroidota bacterium]
MVEKNIVEITNKIIFDIGGEALNLSIDNIKEIREKLNPYFEELREIAYNKKFSKEEEIYFFKEIKPDILAKIKFFDLLSKMEIEKYYAEVLEDYYKKYLDQIQSHFKDNFEVYLYYKSDETYLDNYYFTRKELKDNVLHKERDPKFSTNVDYIIAEIKFMDMLFLYINKKIKSLKYTEKVEEVKGESSEIKWTDSKIAAVELGYALFSKGVINNGNVDIKDIMGFIENIFNLDLGDYYRTYSSIRERKKDKTAFLNSLVDNLHRKMDEDDIK